MLMGLFDRFWDDLGFLTLGDWQDLPPERARVLKAMLSIADETPIYAAMQRGGVSPGLVGNLLGLLSKPEITECQESLRQP
jgi:hypothetical protein